MLYVYEYFIRINRIPEYFSSVAFYGANGGTECAEIMFGNQMTGRYNFVKKCDCLFIVYPETLPLIVRCISSNDSYKFCLFV